jgi:hypothetical protein
LCTAPAPAPALFEQILLPGYRNRTPESRQKLLETLGELMRLTDELRRDLAKRAVGGTFEESV